MSSGDPEQVSSTNSPRATEKSKVSSREEQQSPKGKVSSSPAPNNGGRNEGDVNQMNTPPQSSSNAQGGATPKPSNQSTPPQQQDQHQQQQQSPPKPELKQQPQPQQPADDGREYKAPATPSGSVAANASSQTVKDFLARESVYMSSKTEGVLALQAWHDRLINFFASQRAPYIQRLDTMQVRVRNGERALSEAKRLVTFLLDLHTDIAKRLRGTTIFGTALEKVPPPGPTSGTPVATTSNMAAPPLPSDQKSSPDATPNHSTLTTSPVAGGTAGANGSAPVTVGTLSGDLPVPEGGAVDPSVLGLAVLASMAYQMGDRNKIMCDQLRAAITSINALARAYGQKAQVDIAQMKTLVKQCEQSTQQIDAMFRQHMELYNYYSRAVGIGHNANAGVSGSTSGSAILDSVEQLTSPKRMDMWKSEQCYREKVVALTKMHESFFTACSQLLEEHSTAEHTRTVKLHAILSDVVFGFGQAHASLHRIASTTQTDMQQCLVTANKNHQLAKQQQQLILQQQQQALLSRESGGPLPVSLPPNASEAKTAAVAAAVVAPPPGPFPANVNVVLAGPAERRTTVFKSWKPVYLVFTKDNFLYCYSYDDLDTSPDVDKFLGPAPTSPTGTVSDPKLARFVLKSKPTDGSQVWTADVYETTAISGDGKDESLINQGIFTINVVPVAFFSSSWSATLRCKTKEEANTWIQTINDHKKV